MVSRPLDVATFVAVRLTRSRLEEETQFRGNSTGTPISSRRGIARRRTNRTSSSFSSILDGLGRVEGEAALGEHGLDQAELPMQRRPRVGRAEEAEDRVAGGVEQGDGECQRRVVGGLEPELEHDRGAVIREVARVLVQTEAEQPGGARAPLEAVVDPVREPALESGEAGVGRQVGLRRREPVEEQLRPARAAPHQPAPEPDSGRAQPVAGDLVDRAGVEVVDELVRVTVERIRADGRQRRGDRVECLLNGVVDRRAPVREPRAAAVLQLRVDEALGDRALCELEDGEGRACRAPRLEVCRRIDCEREQLREADATPGRALTEVGEVGHCRDPDEEAAGREGAVGRAREHGRADVLLPQDLERRVLAHDVRRGGCRRGHELSRIRTPEEVVPVFFG